MRYSFLFCSCLILFVPFARAQKIKYNKQTNDSIYQVETHLSERYQIKGENHGSLSERMAFHNVKAVSIAVIKNYQIVWAKGYGWADESLKIPTTSSTRFQAASVSKSINAVALLKLVQDGKIDLNADINSTLKTWKFPYDTVSKGKKISLANLLSHNAGISVHGFGGYAIGNPIPNLVQILNGTGPANSAPVKSITAPGTGFEYSGGGITISQMMAIDASGVSYETLLHDQVLSPYGMTNSTFEQGVGRNKLKQLATAYRKDGSEVEGKHHIYPELAAAGLWTTPTDLAKYVINTQLSHQGKSNKVLNRKTAEIMLTPIVEDEVGLGVFIRNLDGTKYFEHSGSNEGFQSEYYGSFESGNGVVVMVNSDNGKIIPEIVNSVSQVYGFKGLYRSKLIDKIEIPTSTLLKYVGDYQFAPTAIFKISLENGQLYMKPDDRDKTPVYPEAINKFYLKQTDAQIEFIKNADGNINTLVLTQGSNTQKAERVTATQ